MRTTPSDDIEAIVNFVLQGIVGAHIILAFFAIAMVVIALLVGVVVEMFKAMKPLVTAMARRLT